MRSLEGERETDSRSLIYEMNKMHINAQNIHCEMCICVTRVRLRFDVVEHFGCLSILISNTINLKTPNFLNNNYQRKVIKCHYHLIITVQPNIISNRGQTLTHSNTDTKKHTL